MALGLAHLVVAEPEAEAPDPVPLYGEVRAAIRGVALRSHAIMRAVFHGAVVHGPEGVVTVGRRVVTETLHHVWPPRMGAWREDARWLALRHYPGAPVGAAEHLLTGNSGNYYHWLLDGMARSAVLPPGEDLVLAPAGAAFHGGAAGLLPGRRIGWVGPDQAVPVERLGWSSDPTLMGGAFHPAVLRMARPWAGAGGGGARDVYVTRRDAANRRLVNEAAVEALCASRGFVVVCLSGMTLADQVAVFAVARRIVAAHGAGLANLVFCRAGAAVLELIMDQYGNMCFRRLAACAGVRWGAVIGTTTPGFDPGWIHSATWIVDLDRVAAVLDDPGFVAQETAA